MNTADQLNKWRHLIEPETSSGLTPLPWVDVLATPVRVYEASRSVVVVRDVYLPRHARSIWVAAGDLDEVLELVRDVERDAFDDGVAAIVFMGRRGWIRAACGYKEVATIGLKEL